MPDMTKRNSSPNSTTALHMGHVKVPTEDPES